MIQSLDIFSLLHLFGISQGLFLFIYLLLTQKGKTDKKKWLTILIFCLTCVLVDFFMHYSKMSLRYPHTMFLSQPMVFLFGPLIYIFFKTNEQNQSVKFYIKHFGLPFLVLIVILSSYTILSTEDKFIALKQLYWKMEESSRAPVEIHGIRGIFYGLFWRFQLGVYLFLVYKKYYSSFRSDQLIIFWGFVVFWLAFFTVFIFSFIYTNALFSLTPLLTIICVIQIYLIAYSLLKYPRQLNKEKRPYEKSTLREEDAKQLREQLVNYIQTEKLFLTPNLKIDDLSKKLKVSSKHLSQIINQHYKMNFQEFVNMYRIEEAKRKLLTSDFDHFSVLAIGLDVGFQSKSSFYNAFKKEVHCTPTEYRNRNLDVQNPE